MWSHIRWKSFCNTRSGHGIHCIKTYIIRSTSCPFQVEIRGYITDMIYRNETFDTLFLQTSGRWVSLLAEYEESQTLLLLMPLRDKLPTLQHLFIMCSKNISFLNRYPFRYAPYLKYFSIGADSDCTDLSGASTASLSLY
jgi:hypothetical protein